MLIDGDWSDGASFDFDDDDNEINLVINYFLHKRHRGVFREPSSQPPVPIIM